MRSTATPHAALAATPSATRASLQLEQLVDEARDHRPLGHFRHPLTPLEKVPSGHGMHSVVLATLKRRVPARHLIACIIFNATTGLFCPLLSSFKVVRFVACFGK